MPTGPIVESYPTMRAMPMMMAMPMMPMMYGSMPVSRAVSYEEQQPRSREPEPTCSKSGERLDELEARIDALDTRMKTILRAVELQTQVLEEIRTNGSIGKAPIPQK